MDVNFTGVFTFSVEIQHQFGNHLGKCRFWFGGRLTRFSDVEQFVLISGHNSLQAIVINKQDKVCSYISYLSKGFRTKAKDRYSSLLSVCLTSSRDEMVLLFHMCLIVVLALLKVFLCYLC